MYNQHTSFFRLCDHVSIGVGFAIISFLRKISKAKQKHMSHSALLEAKNEIKEIKENLSGDASHSKKALSLYKKKLVRRNVDYSRHISKATKFIEKHSNDFTGKYIQEVTELLDISRDTIDIIHRGLEWEETQVVKKTYLFLLKLLRNLESVILNTLESKNSNSCDIDIQDTDIEDESDPSMWIDNALFSKRITVKSTFKQIGYHVPHPWGIDDDIEE